MPIRPHIIALDIGGTNTRAALLDRDHKIVDCVREKTAKTGVAQLVGQITDLTRLLSQRHGKPVGAGLSVAGSVDHRQGILIETPNLPFPSAFPLQTVMQDALALPVFVNSELKAAALGELHYGAAKDKYRDVVVITIGTGLGAGVIINGDLYHGANYVAGEMGHTPAESGRDAPVCGCGRHGCLEAYSAGPALSKRMEEARSEKLEPATILAMAAKGDRQATLALENVSRYIGISIANTIMYYDPEIVVLRGNFVLNAWSAIRGDVYTAVRERSMSRQTPIVLSSLGDDGALYGLARWSASDPRFV